MRRIAREASQIITGCFIIGACFYSLLLACLVSETVPPFLQTSGHDLSVMGSCGSFCQAVNDRLGRWGFSFFSSY